MTQVLAGGAPINRILLTYGWVRSSYAVLRNLARRGLSVHVADSFRTGMCQWSRYKAGFDLYPSHYEDEAGFVDAVASMCDKHDLGLIFPSHNETEILARHRDHLGSQRCALLPDVQHCALFNNKARAYEHAKAVGVPVPQRIAYGSHDELASQVRRAGLKRTVIKLLTGNSGKGVFYAETPEEAQERVAALVREYRLEPDRLPQVEERVTGEGWGTSVLYWKGEGIAAFTHRRLREKIETGGTSTLRESRRHPGLEAAAERLFSSIGWHGLAMAEFKVCPDTGKFWFIEVNPRLWGSLPLAVSAGMEFPYLAWLCASNGPQAARDWLERNRPQMNWRSRWILGDALVFARDAARLRPLAAFRKLANDRADACDDFFVDDPCAFAGEVVRYVVGAAANRSLNGAPEGMVG